MIPRSLRAVALIQLLGGLIAAIGMLVQLSRGFVNIDFGVLGIPIYFGLSRLSSGWRTCALVFLWWAMIGAPIAFLVGLGSSAAAHFQVFGIRLASLSPVWLSVVAVPHFLLNLWQYRVLTRPDVRAAFHPPAAELPTGT